MSFGRHLLLERINVGGMAEVFKAKSFGVEGFERIVAVKRILPTMAEDDEFVTMFVDEARIASHLTHQNIVQIYELGKHEGGYYISMEYIAGRDLRQILDHHKRLKKPMDVAKACYVASRVCEALEYAHKKKDPAGKDLKIIHRDVSPQNVIISFEGEVKLCDFGIAKAASRVSRTQVGVLKGKFAYMSPEQVRGQATDRRSDLFALGVIFYEMLTGERLFLGESDYSTLEAVRNARVPAPTQYNAKIPATLEKIMMRLLARDPKDRYQWASEAHEDLLDHVVQDGKIYHGRHLRGWMQDVYARDIEIENAKLEEFMKLRLPEARSDTPLDPNPSPVVLAMAEAARREEQKDPALAVPTYVAPPRAESEDEIEHVDRSDGAITANEIQQPKLNGASPVPQLASASPVSSIFGTPKLDDEQEEAAVVRATEDSDPKPSFSTGPADDTYIPASRTMEGEHLPIETADADFERTQFDVVNAAPDGNDTLYDPNEANDPLGDDEDETNNGETLTGEGMEAEIRAAQSELIDRLDAEGALDGGETVDAGEDSEEYVSPYVFDPSESSVTSENRIPGSGPKVQAPAVSDPGAMDDKTNVSFSAKADPTPMDGVEAADFDTNGELELGLEGEEGTMEGGSTYPELDMPPAVEPNPQDVIDSRARSRSMASRAPSVVPKPVGLKKPPSPSEERRIRTNGTQDGLRIPTAHRRRIWEIRGGEEKDQSLEHSDQASTRTPPPSVPERREPMTGAHVAVANGYAEMSPRPMPLAEEAMPLLRDAAPPSGLTFRDPRVLMLIAAAVGVLAIALLITLLVARGSGASLHIVTEPVKNVEVKLDGRVIGVETPVEKSIDLGLHTVELRAPGFHPYTQVVQISEPKPHTMVVPLEPIDPAAPNEAKAADNDAAKNADKKAAEEEADPAESAPRKRTELVPDEEKVKEPIRVTTKIDEPRDAKDVKDVKVAEAKIEPRPDTKTEARLEKSEPAKQIAKPKQAPAAAEEGYLLVSTKPPGVAVWIDGKKTSLKTPIRTPHPVSAGKHVISFEMEDGQKYSFEVTVAPGETKKLVKPLR